MLPQSVVRFLRLVVVHSFSLPYFTHILSFLKFPMFMQLFVIHCMFFYLYRAYFPNRAYFSNRVYIYFTNRVYICLTSHRFCHFFFLQIFLYLFIVCVFCHQLVQVAFAPESNSNWALKVSPGGITKNASTIH